MVSTHNIHRRSAFTLIELMVVITIIALLVAMTVGTLRNAIGAARQRQTEATIQKIHGLMQQRIDAFNRAVDRLNLTPAKQKLRLNFNVSYGSPNFFLTDLSPVLNVLVRKQLYQSRFPQNFAERNLLFSTSATLPPPAPHNPVTQSSALLYWILTGTEVFGVPPVDSGEFTSAEVRDTDSDGLMEFIDGWGRPLRYYRWPTQLFRPGGGTNAINRLYPNAIWSGVPPPPAADVNGNITDIDPLLRDPEDQSAQMFYVANQDPSMTIFTAFEDLFNTPSTFNAFLIMSAGPDGQLGMHEPFDYFGTSDPTQVPPATTTWTAFQIPNVSSPTLGTAQGRLAAVTPLNATLEGHPINDNITNRKR